MKVFKLLIVLLMVVNASAFSQCKEIKQAVKAMNVNNIDSAKASLKLAEDMIVENGVASVNEKCMAKYHYTKAAVHLMMGQKEDSLVNKVKLFNISQNQYEKYLSVNKGGDLHDMVMSNLLSLSIEYSNVGVEYYQEKNYDKALKYTQIGIALKKKHHPSKIKDLDSFNAMVFAKLVGDYEQALTYADSLLANPKLKKDDRIKYLGQKLEILTISNKSEEALKLIDTLKILDPNDEDLKLAELQILLNKDMNVQAIALLNDITKRVKNRQDLWVIKGQLHFHQNEIDSSVASFSNALILNENNYSALYGLGVIYTNKGSENLQKMKNSFGQKRLVFEENRKIDYGIAIGYLMKILSVKTEDMKSLTTLKMIYNQLSDIKNEEEIKRRIQEINNPSTEEKSE